MALRPQLPRTTETIWPMMLLIGGCLSAFVGWATASHLAVVGSWVAALRALLAIGLASAAVGAIALVVGHSRAQRGVYLLGGAANGYAGPAIVLLLLVAYLVWAWIA